MLNADADPTDPGPKGHTMTEQDPTPDIDLDDTEGHTRHREDEDQDDTEGHTRHREDEDQDDTEGHTRHR